MNCRYCNKPLSFLQKVAGQQFCSAAHQKAFSQQLDQLAVERLMQSRPVAPPPQAESEPAPTPQVEVAKEAVSHSSVKVSPPPQPVITAEPPRPPEPTPAEKPQPAARQSNGNGQITVDDDIELPAFVVRGKSGKGAGPQKGNAPKKAERYSIDDLDDVPLPKFLTEKGKKAQEKPSSEKTSGAGNSDEVVIPKSARRPKGEPERPAAAARAKEEPAADKVEAPPPFITRQGRGGQRPGGPIVVPPAALVTPPPAAAAEPVAPPEPVQKAPAPPPEPQPQFDRFVLPAFESVEHWIRQVPVDAPASFEALAQPAVRFASVPLRMPVLELAVDPYVAPEVVHAGPVFVDPELSTTVRVDVPARETSVSMRSADSDLSAVVPVGPDVELLLAAPSVRVMPEMQLAHPATGREFEPERDGDGKARVSPVGMKNLLASIKPQIPAKCEALAELTSPEFEMSAAQRLAISASAPPEAKLKEIQTAAKPFQSQPAPIPAQLKALAAPQEPGFETAANRAIAPSPSVSAPGKMRQAAFAIRAFHFLKPQRPARLDTTAAVAAPQLESAGTRPVEVRSTGSEPRLRYSRFAARAFPKFKVQLPQALMALAAPIFAAAGLQRHAEPDALSKALRHRDIPGNSRLRYTASKPALGCSTALPPADPAGVPALFRGETPAERLFPFVDQFAVQPVSSEPTAAGFGAADHVVPVTLMQCSLTPAPPEVKPVALAMASRQANVPHRKVLPIALAGKDYPASPLLSPLVCDFASAPMAKVIHK